MIMPLVIGTFVVCFFTASFVIWRLFRMEQYDGKKSIDIVFVAFLGALLGARIVWLVLHYNDVSWSLYELVIPRSLSELSSLGSFLGLVFSVALFAKLTHWPYIATMYKVAWGGLIMAVGSAIIFVLAGTPIDILSWVPILSYKVQPIFYLLYVLVIGCVALMLYKKNVHQSIGITFFLLVIPQIPTLALGIIAAIVMWYYTKYARS